MPMRLVRLVHRVARPHWQAITIGLVVLATSFVGGFAIIANGRQSDAEARQRAEITRQFCTAIPNVASRTAQALVDVVVADDKAHHIPQARIDNTVRLGRLYVGRARTLALEDLPACKQIKEAP